jgi:hypothetical protein
MEFGEECEGRSLTSSSKLACKVSFSRCSFVIASLQQRQNISGLGFGIVTAATTAMKSISGLGTCSSKAVPDERTDECFLRKHIPTP